MADSLTPIAIPTANTWSKHSAISPVGEILRDIARGGFAGAIVGVFVAGLGGRLVMQLAAILHPDAAGRGTEFGAQIGQITIPGSIALIVIGLVSGLIPGTVWVVVSPWIPGSRIRRAILAMPIAIALGAIFVVDGDNRDFPILRHDPLVVGMLLALIAGVGLMMAIVDGWLDRRLPHPGFYRSRPLAIYAVIATIGAFVAVPGTVASFVKPEFRSTDRMLLALVVVGLATLTLWVRRVRGQAGPSQVLTIVGRGALLVAVILGGAALLPEVSRALGQS